MKVGREHVDAYIAAAAPKARPMLRLIRRAIKAGAPRAVEGTSYRMPYYQHHGRLAYFAAFKHHVSFYALGRSTERYAKQVARYRSSKATLQFPLGSKVPEALIRKLVEARAAENEAKARARRRG